jgi:ATP-dependent exoDNAse (exonuclease V) alpha subunit
MKFLSAQIDTVARSKGQNAVAAAAYNARTKLALKVIDQTTGIETELSWDYTRLRGLAFSQIYLPEELQDLPNNEWLVDREALWNEAEKSETRRNSRSAHKIMLPLPNDLSLEANIALLEEFISQLTKEGMVIDANIHDDDPKNIHAHLLGTMRKVVRAADGSLVFSKVKERSWHHLDFVNRMRKLHCDIVNKHLLLNGMEADWEHRSFGELNIDLLPTKHEGPARNIKNSELVELNQEINHLNAERIKQNPEIILDYLQTKNMPFSLDDLATVINNKIGNQGEMSDPLSLVERILDSGLVVATDHQDAQGRTLYTTRQSLEQERDLTKNASALHDSAEHNINLTTEQFDHWDSKDLVFEGSGGQGDGSSTHGGVLSAEQHSETWNIKMNASGDASTNAPGKYKNVNSSNHTATEELQQNVSKDLVFESSGSQGDGSSTHGGVLSAEQHSEAWNIKMNASGDASTNAPGKYKNVDSINHTATEELKQYASKDLAVESNGGQALVGSAIPQTLFQEQDIRQLMERYQTQKRALIERSENHSEDKIVAENSSNTLSIEGFDIQQFLLMKDVELLELNKIIATLNLQKIKNNPASIIDLLMLKKAVFSREQLLAALEREVFKDIDVLKHTEITEQLCTLAEEILASDMVKQAPKEDLLGRAVYTSSKRLDLEHKFIEQLESLRDGAAHRMNLSASSITQYSFFEKLTMQLQNWQGKQQKILTPEQEKAVLAILNGQDLSVLVGLPGTGKTTVLQEVKRQYQKKGKQVIGLAPSSAAALQLSKSLGITCLNTSQWRKLCDEAEGNEFVLELSPEFFHGKEQQQLPKRLLSNKHIVIVDEASMVDVQTMAFLMMQCCKYGAKLIVVGDENQLPAVGWGGALQKTIEIAGEAKLVETQRQKNLLHQEATKLLSQGKLRKAMALYQEDGALLVEHDTELARERCLKEFVSDYIAHSWAQNNNEVIGKRHAVIGVLLNETRHAMNLQVREKLKAAGILHGKEQEVCNWQVGANKETIKLAIGEQIVFSRNLKVNGLQIVNGEVATVLAISKPNDQGYANISLRLFKADGRTYKFNLPLQKTWKYLGRYADRRPLFEYGYAVTAHKLQGVTVKNMYVMIEKNSSLEAFLVLASRHLEQVTFFVGQDLLSEARLEALAGSTTKAHQKYQIQDERFQDEIDLDNIVHLLARSADNNLAANSWRDERTSQEKILGNYFKARNDTKAALQKMIAWQERTRRLTGQKPELWEDKELWDAFKGVQKIRGNLAQIILKDLSNFRLGLAQYNINFATLEDHARAVGYTSLGKKDEKVISNVTDFFQQQNYQQLLALIAQDGPINVSLVMRYFEQITLMVANTEAELVEKIETMAQIHAERNRVATSLDSLVNRCKQLMPAYLQNIFIAPEGLENDAQYGQHLVAQFDLLYARYGEEAIQLVTRNPKLLGSLRGIGLGQILPLSAKRKVAINLLENLASELKSYCEANVLRKQLSRELSQDNWLTKIEDLQSEIHALKKQIPMHIDEQCLQLIGDCLHKITMGKESPSLWDHVRGSECFAAAIANQYVKEEDNGFQDGVRDQSLAQELDHTYQADNVDAKGEMKARRAHYGAHDKADPSVARGRGQSESVTLQSADNSQERLSKSHSAIKQVASTIDTPAVEHTDHHKADSTSTMSDRKAESGTSQRAEKVQDQTRNSARTNNIKKQKDWQGNNYHLDVNHFQKVKDALTRASKVEIFRKYAPMINHDSKIKELANNISCGSLNMDLQHNDGLWFRFSDQSRGDIFGLVQVATNCSKLSALAAVAEYARVDISNILPSKKAAATDYAPKKPLEDKQIIAPAPLKPQWQVYTSVPKGVEEMNLQKAQKLLKQVEGTLQKVTALYPYKSYSGDLLGYTMRIEVTSTSEGNESAVTRKQVLPIAFCYYGNDQAQAGKGYWRMKGFMDTNGTKPIFGLEQLKQRPDAPILIVEGEKTASFAQKILPEYVVLSWMGGTSSATKADWSKLVNRVVVIWPDNDEVGKKAAKEIKCQIDRNNQDKALVSVIDVDAMKLPEKWDLGDALPEHVSYNDVASAIEKSMSYSFKHIDYLYSPERHTRVMDTSRAVREHANQQANDYNFINPESYRQVIAGLMINRFDEIAELQRAGVSVMPENMIRYAEEQYVSLMRYYEHELQILERNFTRQQRVLFNSNSSNREYIARQFTTHLAVHHHVLLQQQQLLDHHYLAALAGSTVAIINKAQRVNDNCEKHFLYSNVACYTLADDWLNDRIHEKQQRALPLYEQAKKQIQVEKIAHTKQAHMEDLDISKNIEHLKQDLQKTQTLQDAFKVLKNTNQYLANWYKSIKPSYHDPNTVSIVSKAYEQQQNDAISKLGHLASYGYKEKIFDHDSLLDCLKSGKPIDVMHKQIERQCFEHHVQLLNRHCNQIVQGLSIEHNGQEFNCIVKYLQHWQKTVPDELLPMEKMNKVLTSYQQKALEYAHHEPEMSFSK